MIVMESLPDHILHTQILARISDKDKLAVASASKRLYASLFQDIPDFRTRFGSKYQVLQCFRNMTAFIAKGQINAARWVFSIPSSSTKPTTLTICRTSSSSSSILINDKPFPAMTQKHLEDWVVKHLFPKWDSVQMGMGCWYKSPIQRRRYQDLTIRMTELLSVSL